MSACISAIAGDAGIEVDSDWAGDVGTRRSRGGGLELIGSDVTGGWAARINNTAFPVEKRITLSW